MSNNNHKNSNCAFAEPLISYLYGESGAAEKIEFETHLETCAGCVNELTEFAFARSAVREWRGLEFDQLATPIFEIPAANVQLQPLAQNSRSRFSDWRRIFTFKPALGMAVCALLIGLFGAAIFIFNAPGENEIAGSTGNQNTLKTVVAPANEKITEQPKQIAADNHENSAAPSAPLPTKAVDKKFAAPKVATVKVAANAPVSKLPEMAPIRVVQNTNGKNAVQTDQKATVAEKTKNSRLTEVEDEEDNSVRLADLFDEIGTK